MLYLHDYSNSEHEFFGGRHFHYYFSCVHYLSCHYIFLRSLIFNNFHIFSFDRVLGHIFAIVAEIKHLRTVNLQVYYEGNIEEKWLKSRNRTVIMRKQKYHEQCEYKSENLLWDKAPTGCHWNELQFNPNFETDLQKVVATSSVLQ